MLNKVILIGRIGQISNIAATTSGNPMINYSLATSKSIKDRDTGQFTDHTEWHRLVSFGKAAEHIATKLAQGDLIYVEGENRTRKWDKNGIDMYNTEVIVDAFPKKLPRYFTQQSDNPSYQQQGNHPQQPVQHQGQQHYPQPSHPHNPMDLPDF